MQVHWRTYIVISTAQTHLGLRSRTFSLKINKLPTFCEINQGWQCLKIVFIWSNELNFNFIIFQTLDTDPNTPNTKTCTTNHKITQP